MFIITLRDVLGVIAVGIVCGIGLVFYVEHKWTKWKESGRDDKKRT